MATTEAQGLRIVITGASRGLGLEFATQYVGDGHTVFALARDPEASSGLVALTGRYPDRCHAVACDVATDAAVAAATAAIGGRTDAVDLLINNAGVSGSTGAGLQDLDFEDARRVFEINVLGPLRMVRACLPLLRDGARPRTVQITSRMGSIADNDSGGWWAYRMSKAALNMANKNLMIEMREFGIATLVLHPGWVQTEMGGAGAPLDAETSVRGMRDVIAGLDAGRSGGFFDYSGTELPW